MSREETNLNPKELENAVSETNVDQTGKKLRRNYCYVCKVQCTAAKNLLDHEKGKRHLKNVSVSNFFTERNEKKNHGVGSRKSSKKAVPSSRSLKPGGKKSLELQLPKTEDSTSPTKLANETMSNSNRHTPKNKRFEYINPNYNNRYSRYHNSRNSYSNDYRNDRRYYDERPYNTHPRWNSHFSNAPVMPNAHNHDLSYGQNSQYYSESGYNAPHENDYFSENRHAFFNSYGNYSETLPVPTNNPVDSVQNSDCSNNNAVNFKTSEKIQLGSNLSPSNSVSKSTRKYYCEDVIPSSSKTSNEKLNDQTSVSSVNHSAVTAESGATTSKESAPTKIICSKFGEKRKIRSRSLSASESCGEKRVKDKSENQTDSDGASDEQRIKEWTNSILETNNNQISRLIHPSTYKEKAAVNHLITRLSKSKRKENLTRTLRSNSLGSTENNDEDVTTDDLNTSVESVNAVCDEISIILDSKETSSNLEQNENYSPTVQKNKKNYSINSDSHQTLITSFDAASGKCPVNQSSKKSSNKIDGKSKDSNLASSKRLPENRKEKSSTHVYQEKYVKRKSLGSDIGNKAKKHRISSTECFERPSTSKTTGLQDSIEDTPTIESAFNPPNSTKTPYQVPSDVLSDFKEELAEPSEVNQAVPSTSANSQNTLDLDLECNSQFSVEALIQLFASGSVKVKEEFNDPVMDAIKGISPDELISACSNDFLKVSETTNKTTVDSNRRNSKDKPTSETSVSTLQENMDWTNPVIMDSAITNENITPVSVAHRSSPSLPNLSSSDKSEDQSCLTNNDAGKSSDNSLSDMKKLNLLNKAKSDLPPHLNKLIKHLQDIASQEESVKQNLTEAKSKISEYSALLEEWKNKKKKLQEQEEELRKQRNDIIKSMQSTIKTSGEDSEEEPETSSVPEESTSVSQPTSSKRHRTEGNVETENNLEMSHTPPSVISTVRCQKQKKSESPESSSSEEITILPSPIKPKPPEIIICDDVEENVPVTFVSKSNFRGARNEMVTNVVSSKGQTFYDVRNLNAHATVINCLMVFEDFLYTCSNDSTGKRFSLKNSSSTVTYLHSAKNVTEIVVEKVQNEALVFTSCSTRVISLFIASSGTKIKTFFPPCAVMSICKGWGKFYSGLANGSVNVYNWKYEEIEIVKTETPASRIATAHQGRLHVLVILSSEGNISIRDAETGLLIRYVKISIKHPSWMTLHNDLVYLSSSDKILIILDIMSGRVEKRLYLNCHTTGLAVHDDHIFTISYSGIVNCYNKDKMADKKLYYGAGKNGLTCVHVYQDWVFTGNRKGDVSLFQFDPSATAICKFGKCDITYGLKEDLEYHIEKDHLKKKNLVRCNWRGCDFTFPKNADTTDKMNHLKSHIYEIHRFL